MINYVIYKNEFGGYIVELLNEGREEMLSAQQELTSKGYIITEMFVGKFIKCFKVEKDN